ncbi:MAG TPA: glycine oxidase ThiO [Solirubrobacteraceae bacterium]
MSQRNRTAADVAVVGGGVIGLAVAWQACRRGLSTVVLERDRAGGGTTFHAAGMIAPVAETTPAEEPLLELGLASARHYERFTRELAEAAGLAEIGYLSCGTLLVARDPDEAEALERDLELRRRYGLPVKRLRPSEARRLEPGLAPVLRLALDVPDDHAIDPRALTAALAAAVGNCGGELRELTAVRGIELADDRVTGLVLADGERLRARNVVIAAGVWSDELEGIPPAARVPLRPVKGQIIRLHDPAGPGLLTRVIRMGASYIVPRGDGRYVIGATQEERGFDTTVTAGAAFELLRDASELVPGISELVIDEMTAGLRPGTPDNLPVIGPSLVEGLHWAVGHRRGGILLAPMTAHSICSSLLGERRDPAMVPFAPGRFAPTAAGSPA